MYNIVIRHFYNLKWDHPTKSSNHLSSYKLITILSTVFPFPFHPSTQPFLLVISPISVSVLYQWSHALLLQCFVQAVPSPRMSSTLYLCHTSSFSHGVSMPSSENLASSIHSAPSVSPFITLRLFCSNCLPVSPRLLAVWFVALCRRVSTNTG